MRTLKQKAWTLFLCLAVFLPGSAMALQIPGPVQRTRHFSPETVVLNLARQIRKTSLDCSHLVNELYTRAGLGYTYADSRKLYEGVSEFKRVFEPRAGDLVAWRGHVGIVVDPAQRTFVSALRTGVKLANYDSPYWKKKGSPRFLRYTSASEQGPEFWIAENSSRPARGSTQDTRIR